MFFFNKKTKKNKLIINHPGKMHKLHEGYGMRIGNLLPTGSDGNYDDFTHENAPFQFI